MSLFLITFGFMTYYWIPLAMYNENIGAFFYLMLCVCKSIVIGMILVSAMTTEWL